MSKTLNYIDAACTGRVGLTAEALNAMGLVKTETEYKFWIQFSASVFALGYTREQAENYANEVLKREEQSVGAWVCKKHDHAGETRCILCLLGEMHKERLMARARARYGKVTAQELTPVQVRDLERWEAYEKMLEENSADEQAEEKASTARAEAAEGFEWVNPCAVACNLLVWVLFVGLLSVFAWGLSR